MTTDRIKFIDNFIDNIITQKEWEDDYNKRFEALTNKYSVELEYYNYIKKEKLNKLKIGGYIKYINTKDELLFGGALINITGEYMYMKKDDIIIKINKFKNLIFYRNHRTSTDKLRDIFVTGMEKYS
jgi:hypothetical protein